MLHSNTLCETENTQFDADLVLLDLAVAQRLAGMQWTAGIIFHKRYRPKRVITDPDNRHYNNFHM